MGIDEGEDLQAKEIHNIFNKIKTDKFPNLEKTMPIQVQEASRTSKTFTKIELPHGILSLKQQAQGTVKEY
jgi:hypothetical protein